MQSKAITAALFLSITAYAQQSDIFMQQATGTSTNPESAPMAMKMTTLNDWMFMWMAQGFINYTVQTGPRGGDKLFAPNTGMLAATHPVGGGTILLRTMLSLEPATVTGRRYPLLFQTGETAFGKPIVDGQHPHDFFMELAIGYAHPIGEKFVANIYAAPVGDPALGPVGFPHRASASELPQAPISHHWMDSTHIADEVITGGITGHNVRLEVSGFHGAEPDEFRWNIDHGAIDSWSTRLSVFPTPNWQAQISTGRLTKPEALEPGDVERTTASVSYSNGWSATLAWGRNYKIESHRSLQAILAEAVVPFKKRNFITGRFEWSQRDELFEDGRIHDIAEYTLGYTRDIPLIPNIETGLGMNFTAYIIPAEITPAYGNHPVGVNVFLRFRLQ